MSACPRCVCACCHVESCIRSVNLFFVVFTLLLLFFLVFLMAAYVTRLNLGFSWKGNHNFFPPTFPPRLFLCPSTSDVLDVLPQFTLADSMTGLKTKMWSIISRL